MSVEFKDNSKAVLAAMEAAKKKALTAIGKAAVEETMNYMRDTSRYGPGSKGAGIWDSGDLIGDVNDQPSQTPDAVDIGNSLEYAPWVHNGTARMKARPYLRDAITENADIWKEIAEEHIRNGFKGISIDTSGTETKR